MRKLLNTLYVTIPEAYLARDGENVLIKTDNEIKFRIPIHNLEGIVCFGFAGASPGLMHLCCERGVALSFLTEYGKFMGRVTGRISGNILLRRNQYRWTENDAISLRLAKRFILAKIINSRAILHRAVRDHPQIADTDLLTDVMRNLAILAKSRGVELKLTPIGKEAFVFFVNSRNTVNGLTTAQIQDIYSGKITNWKELGGKNAKIRAFQRPENSGSQTMLQKLMKDKNLMTPPREDVVSGMGGIIERTASYRNYKNAIGYSFLFFATEMIKNNEIKLLEVDGIKPDRDTIASGKYPLASDFYAVTANSDNPNVDRFIEWILSEQGQYLVEKTG